MPESDPTTRETALSDVARQEAHVSERFDGVARVSSKGPVASLSTLDDATVEVAVNGSVQRLPVAAAAQIASAINAAIDHMRHENPDLLMAQPPSASEIEFASKVVEWVRILETEGRKLDTISHSGIERSMLLRRLRSGRAPMRAPPPTSFGQPWYEVLEGDSAQIHLVTADGKPTTLAELLGTLDASATARNQFLVKINDCYWNVIKTVEFGKKYVVSYQGHAQMFALGQVPDGRWALRKYDPPKA